MAPGSSSSSSAFSSNGFYANDRSVFIDAFEHQYRDLDLPVEDSCPFAPLFLQLQISSRNGGTLSLKKLSRTALYPGPLVLSLYPA
jgi:hypothetical protein